MFSMFMCFVTKNPKSPRAKLSNCYRRIFHKPKIQIDAFLLKSSFLCG
jgi:hypothetical protein